jgi:Spy/CpxP family protein refolding chaperone
MKIRTAKLPVSLATAALLVSAAAYAGPPDHDGSWRMGPPNAEQRLARMSQELDLDPVQSQQMLQLLQEADADHEAVRARFFEEAGPELCAIRQNTEAEILALLTPEQAEQFQLLKEENALQRKLKQRGRHGAFPDCAEIDD